MYKKLYSNILYLLLGTLLQSNFFCFSSNFANEPRVLILRQMKRGTIEWGGIATHTITLYKGLLKAGIATHILVPAHSKPEEILAEQKLPFFTFQDGPNFLNSEKVGDPEAMYQVALNLCQKYKINIIHINFGIEMNVAKRLCAALHKTQKIKIVFQQHGSSKKTAAHGATAFITANKSSIEFVKRNKFRLQCIKNLPPLTQLNFSEKIDINLSQADFFKKRFDITINPDIPVLCCIGHFFECKNHEGLFEAIHKLMYDYKIPVQLALAGDGTAERSTYLKQLVKKLHIQNSVYFLGFVKNIQEFLFYSDIKVLVSKEEPFALAAIEAALMKKPMVISKKAGVADTFIFHKKTGLLCNPNSVEDIALQIKYLIQHPSIAQSLGQAAYDKVSKYYLENELVMEYINVYKEILK